MIGKRFFQLFAAAALMAGATPAAAQITPVDPNEPYQPAQAQDQSQDWPESPDGEYQPVDGGSEQAAPADEAQPQSATPAPAVSPARNRGPVQDTIPREDVFSAAEGVFGQGAAGLAGVIEKILKDQGEPTAYIAGQEASGAFVAGVRYGSGTMRHQIEGDRAVHWTGPSVGFDFGADANKVFVLVYNLHDSQELFKRFPGAEGNAYMLGGFTASYHRRGDVVLIPVRLGVGLRLGVNAGYMRFSEKSRWLPF